MVRAESTEYHADLLGIGSRLNPNNPDKGIYEFAEYILENPEEIWHEAGNAYPDEQLPEFRGMPTLYPTNDRDDDTVNPDITIDTILFVVKMYMRKMAYGIGDWYLAQDGLAEFVMAERYMENESKETFYHSRPIYEYSIEPDHPLLGLK